MKNTSGELVGYLPAEVAQRLAPLIDNGNYLVDGYVTTLITSHIRGRGYIFGSVCVCLSVCVTAYALQA